MSSCWFSQTQISAAHAGKVHGSNALQFIQIQKAVHRHCQCLCHLHIMIELSKSSLYCCLETAYQYHKKIITEHDGGWTEHVRTASPILAQTVPLPEIFQTGLIRNVTAEVHSTFTRTHFTKMEERMGQKVNISSRFWSQKPPRLVSQLPRRETSVYLYCITISHETFDNN